MSLDQATRDSLSLTASYLTLAHDTLVFNDPASTGDAVLAQAYLDQIAREGPSPEARAAALEASGAVRAAVAAAINSEQWYNGSVWQAAYGWASGTPAYDNAEWFPAKKAALAVLSERIRARVATGDNLAGSHVDNVVTQQGESLWTGAVDRETARGDCTILGLFTGERTIAETWACLPLSVKIFAGVFGAGVLMTGAGALGIGRRR